MKMVFMFGHRDCPGKAVFDLLDAAKAYINENPGEEIVFVVGHRGQFDGFATRAISIVKSMYPQVRLWQLIAYYNPVKKHFQPDDVDTTYFPIGLEQVPKPYAIVKANEAVLAQCDAVICYVWHTASNTQKLLKKARRRGIPIYNLADKYHTQSN